MPSALTGNTSGLATAVSPGLVGTGTQTFAGKKTLDGGALIKGDTSGVAIPSGYLGYFVRATSSSFFTQASPGSGSFYAVPNLSLSLPFGGNWLVGYSCVVQSDVPVGLGTEIAHRSKLRNNTDSTDICGAVSNFMVPGNLAGSMGNGTSQNIITISAAKTIQVYIGYIANSGTPTVANAYERGDRNSPYSHVYAVLIG